MPQNSKTIAGVSCTGADWQNLVASQISSDDFTTDILIQDILYHPMVTCISVPWLFSYHYRQVKEKMPIKDARTHSCRKILQVLNSI